jgi:hypothetical protein
MITCWITQPCNKWKYIKLHNNNSTVTLVLNSYTNRFNLRIPNPYVISNKDFGRTRHGVPILTLLPHGEYSSDMLDIAKFTYYSFLSLEPLFYIHRSNSRLVLCTCEFQKENKEWQPTGLINKWKRLKKKAHTILILERSVS